MNLYKRRIKVGRAGTKINIYHLTDTHDGDDGCDQKLLKEVIHKIELDPNGYWLHGGDIITPDRPSQRERKSATTHDRPEVLTHEDEKSLLWLEEKMFPKWQPIAKKCIGVVAGDHFIRFGNGQNSAEVMCQRLGLPYLGERLGYSSLIFDDGHKHVQYYDMVLRHGIGAASTPGGDVAALVRQSAQWYADAHFGGHTHKENCHPVSIMRPDVGHSRLNQHIVWHVRGGSFLRGYLPGKTTYVEKAEYAPLSVGWAEVHLTLGYQHGAGISVTHSSAELHAA